MIRNEWLGVFLLLLCGVGWMAVLWLYRRRGPVDPEWRRKLLHVGSGLLVLPLPELCRSWAPVFAMCAASAGFLAVLRGRRLRNSLGSVLNAVGRRSAGDLCFPVAVALLFVLAGGNRLLYWTPLLIFTFADTAAALAGSSAQRPHFWGRGPKTLEGSLAFLLTAFAATALMLTLLSPEPAAWSAGAALLLAILLSAVEAACLFGLDNLMVPLCGFFLLRWVLGMNALELGACLAAAAALVMLLLLEGCDVFSQRDSLS